MYHIDILIETKAASSVDSIGRFSYNNVCMNFNIIIQTFHSFVVCDERSFKQQIAWDSSSQNVRIRCNKYVLLIFLTFKRLLKIIMMDVIIDKLFFLFVNMSCCHHTSYCLIFCTEHNRCSK